MSSQDQFRTIRERLPRLVLQGCASGCAFFAYQLGPANKWAATIALGVGGLFIAAWAVLFWHEVVVPRTEVVQS